MVTIAQKYSDWWSKLTNKINRVFIPSVGRIVLPLSFHCIVEGKYIPLSPLASIRPAMAPSEIRHISKRRAVQINAYLASGIDLKQASLVVAAHIKDIIKNYSKTSGTSFRIGGEDIERKVSEKEMLLAVLLAIFWSMWWWHLSLNRLYNHLSLCFPSP